MELLLHIIVMIALAFAATHQKDADAAQASISYLHGDGYASGDDTRNTLRLDALAVKDWGMIYGRADVASFDDRNSNIYTRGIGHYLHGVHLAGQLQNQRGISQSSIGVGYSKFGKDESGFLDFYIASSSYYGDSAHVFGYLNRNIGQSYRLSGFVELIMPTKGHLDPVTFSQAQALKKVGDVWVGVEHQRYFNKNGIRGLDESVNQLLVKWEF